jgi:hypothetical protein
MKVVKINKKQLFDMIQEEAAKLRKELELNEASEKAFTSAGNPTDLEMNKNDKEGDSDKALTYKDTKKKEEKAGEAKSVAPADVEMNANDDEGGSDEKAATAVSVKAGAAKKGNGPTTGLHKANFESKTENPSKESSEPFVEKAEEKMNSMDKENDEGTKTFVEAGAETKGKGPTTGMHKVNVKEKAPAVKDKEPIAKGIEMKESYKKSELISFIKTEAHKLAKKEMLEEELKRLNGELNSLSSKKS